MKYLKVILIILISLLFMCGCMRTVSGTSDELVMNRWGSKDEFGMTVDLYFCKNTGTITIESAKELKTTITGTVIVDEKTFTIADANKKSTYTFNYILYGDKIDLSYNDSVITLKKDK